MSIRATTSGSGSFGGIAPGWNVSEYTTPVTIGESAGGTGNVSFNAKANDDTLFLVNNEIVTVEETLGTIAGVVTSVSQTGLNASIAHNTKLAALDANLEIPALGAGGVVPAIDIVSQLTKRDILLTEDTGYFYSLTGHSQGFDSDGNPATQKFFDGQEYIYIEFGGDGSNDIILRYEGQIGAINGSGFFAADDKIYASAVKGDYFDDNESITSSRVYFKTLLDTSQLFFSAGSTLPVSNSFEGSYFFSLSFDKATSTVYLTGKYVSGGTQVNLTDTTSLSSLDLDKEIAVFIEFRRPSGYSGTHVINYVVANTDNYASAVSDSQTYTAVRAKGSSWTISNSSTSNKSGVRSLYRVEDRGLPTGTFIETDRNHVLNPSFKSGIANWSSINGGVLSASTTGRTDSASLKVTSPAPTATRGASYRLNVDPTFPLSETNISAYVRGENSLQTTIVLTVEEYDANNNLIYNHNQYDGRAQVSTFGGTQWATVSRYISRFPGTAYFIINITSYANDFYIDDVMVSKGFSPYIVPEYFDGDTTDTAEYNYSYLPNGSSLKEVSASALNREYQAPESYTYSQINLGGPVPATNSNGWQYIQDACAVYEEEVAVINNMIMVRPIGQNVVEIDNIVGAPTVTPTIVLSGRNVEVNYSDAELVNNGILYNARTDSNRVLTVEAGERTTTKVSINSSPTIINKPIRSSTAWFNDVPTAGLYAVSSTTVVIPDNLWERHGGDIQVAVSEDDPRSLDITIIGPDTLGNIFGGETALYPGPYKIGYNADDKEYAALSVTGYGVRFEENTLKLATAADPDKVSQDVAKSITNPFVDTLERAYDRGIWASVNASGPVVTMSGTIPVNNVDGFGLVAGSLIRYRDSIYRITDATIGNIGVNFNAVRHVTVGDVDALWASDTVEKFDLMWVGLDTSDEVIAPLRYIGDDESVLMFLDTDVNPYYDFTGEPEISVFPDTDYNPYYVEGGNLEGEDEILLDQDDNPYDGGDGYGS